MMKLKAEHASRRSKKTNPPPTEIKRAKTPDLGNIVLGSIVLGGAFAAEKPPQSEAEESSPLESPFTVEEIALMVELDGTMADFLDHMGLRIWVRNDRDKAKAWLKAFRTEQEGSRGEERPPAPEIDITTSAKAFVEPQTTGCIGN
jgi:hypothetical protein